MIFCIPVMGRHPPPIEKQPVRRTISLPHNVWELAQRYLKERGAKEEIDDFSDLIEKALKKYAADHGYPDLFDQITADIRDGKLRHPNDPGIAIAGDKAIRGGKLRPEVISKRHGKKAAKG